jgi:transketolase
MKNKKSSQEVALGVRRRVFEHSIKNNGGYLSQACSSAEQLSWLYNEELNLGDSVLPMVPKDFDGVPSIKNKSYHTGAGYNGAFKSELDRLIIAPAHYALVAYATLIEVGRMAPEALDMFNKDGSSVEIIGAEHSPGMEMHNGTLGIGLSTGAGLAMGRKIKGEKGEVCVFMSDGELQEGQIWEAIQASVHHGIDNLWAIMDVNSQQVDGAMSAVMDVGDIEKKINSFGALAIEIDAHDINAMKEARKEKHEGRPLIILARSSPYQGMSYLKKRFPRLHYVRFSSEEERKEMNFKISNELQIEPIQY